MSTLLLLLRWLRDTALVFLPLVFAAVMTAATAQLVGLGLNYADVIVMPLLFGLGVDNGVHLITRWRHDGDLQATLASSTPRAMVLSGQTTLVSFATLALAGQFGIASLGVLLGIGIAWMLFASIVLVPALLSVMTGSDQ